jgi:EAL domain-containing protein (putative c-di-GMP-specific phosphodiesterase class I)
MAARKCPVLVETSLGHASAGLSASPAAQPVDVSLVSLGRSLHVETVAEEVETEEQLMLARASGCTHAQGFLFGRPCPVRELDFTRQATRKQKGAAA